MYFSVHSFTLRIIVYSKVLGTLITLSMNANMYPLAILDYNYFVLTLEQSIVILNIFPSFFGLIPIFKISKYPLVAAPYILYTNQHYVFQSH